jgi:hypothetical protein
MQQGGVDKLRKKSLVPVRMIPTEACARIDHVQLCGSMWQRLTLCPCNEVRGTGLNFPVRHTAPVAYYTSLQSLLYLTFRWLDRVSPALAVWLLTDAYSSQAAIQ